MLDHFTDKVAYKAKETAQTAAIGLGAFLCLAVGAVFLTGAAWLFLLTITTALVACLIIGFAFFGIGLLLIATISIQSSARRKRKHVMEAQARSAHTAQMTGGLVGIAGIVAAFVNGLNEGRRSRS